MASGKWPAHWMRMWGTGGIVDILMT
jgi:hypothetical protein